MEKLKFIQSKSLPPYTEYSFYPNYSVEVIGFHNSSQTVLRLLSDSPDLIVIDQNLPQTDLLALIKQINETPATACIPKLVVDPKEFYDNSSPTYQFIQKINSSEECLQKKRILIVDDEFDIVELIANRFETEGFEVIKSINGRTALQKVKIENPDIIIMDVAMPQIDGFHVCRILKESNEFRNIPVVLLTARTSKEDRKMGREVHADKYLLKPFEPEELIKTVAELLSISK